MSSSLRVRPSTAPHGPRSRVRSTVIDPDVGAVKPINKRPGGSMAIPPSISFESVPIRWKGLPLEAALWTFTSQELQHIVSRSIRSSANESFIRLLSIDNLDKDLPAELDRLENAKLMTQSKYRFLVQRRTMLLQAINSRSSAAVAVKDAEEAMSVISTLTAQLSQTAAECDRQIEDLVKIYDQQAQVTKMLDVHWASALAIALRKLNSSYGKRTNELNKARSRISQLEAELNDAWNEAEQLAKEMDEYEEAAANSEDEGEAVVSKAAIVSVPQSPLKESSIPLPMVPTYFTVESLSRNGSRIALTQAPSLNDGLQRYLESPKTVPSEITPAITREPSSSSTPIPQKDGIGPVPSPEYKPPEAGDADDTASFKSNRSIRSNKSTKSTRSTRLSVVSAARRRSNLVSQGSLRLNHYPKSNVSQPPNNVPPVPSLPTLRTSINRLSSSLLSSSKSFRAPKLFSTSSSSSPVSPSTTKRQSSSTAKSLSPRSSSTAGPSKYDPKDPATHDVVLDIRKRTSLEDLHVIDSPTFQVFPESTNGVTADDIYVHARRGTVGDARGLNRISQHISSEDLNLHDSSGHTDEQGLPVSNGIPSIWFSVDAPKTPAERVESLLRQGSKRNPYNKIKTLTKRYSLPFPLFSANKASPPNRTINRRI